MLQGIVLKISNACLFFYPILVHSFIHHLANISKTSAALGISCFTFTFPIFLVAHNTRHYSGFAIIFYVITDIFCCVVETITYFFLFHYMDLIYFIVEDRLARVFPWMNEPIQIIGARIRRENIWSTPFIVVKVITPAFAGESINITRCRPAVLPLTSYRCNRQQPRRSRQSRPTYKRRRQGFGYEWIS